MTDRNPLSLRGAARPAPVSVHSTRAACTWLVSIAALSAACSSGEDSTQVAQPQALTPAPEAETPAQPETPPVAETPSAPSEPEAPAEEPAPSPEAPSTGEQFVLASITIDADGRRVSYAQIIDHLSGDFNNQNGIEASGNAVFMTSGTDFFYGLAESPEWVRYSTVGGFRETGRLSFVNFGITSMDFNNVVVDADTAISVLTSAYQAVVWSPRTMEVKGIIDLPHLQRDGYDLEAFSTVARDGKVYVPGKWVNWESGDVMQRVSVTVLDPATLTVTAVAEDDRCGAAGRVTFDSRGYAYVMGDGRNQSMQVFTAARGEPVVPNCLLRIAPGGTDFEENYFFQIPDLTGGLDSMTELMSASSTLDDGIGFTLMKYDDRISPDLDQVNFEHWSVPAYKTWRITLGDTPVAEEVSGSNFSVVGFSPQAFAGKLYSPESEDGSESSVYEIDPVTNTAVLKFTMDGYFAGLLPLTP